MAGRGKGGMLKIGPSPEDRMHDEPPRRLFRQPHRRRPVRGWVLALLVIVVVIVLLPRLLDRLG